MFDYPYKDVIARLVALIVLILADIYNASDLRYTGKIDQIVGSWRIDVYGDSFSNYYFGNDSPIQPCFTGLLKASSVASKARYCRVHISKYKNKKDRNASDPPPPPLLILVLTSVKTIQRKISNQNRLVRFVDEMFNYTTFDSYINFCEDNSAKKQKTKSTGSLKCY